jgi:exonuclease SbcC
MKIKKIYIQNFKVFTKATFTFEDFHLLVLDGPNGFGKTSLFDAIELLLTGQIRRYVKLGEQTIKGSQTFGEYPFYNQYGEDGDLIIKAEIEHNSQTIILERRAEKTNLSYNQFFNSYKLYTKTDFESQTETQIENEVTYLQNLLGQDYKENFEFLNYIEQEDSTYLLKNKDKDKQDSIAYLFNTQDFENKINKYEEIKKKLLKLCDAPAKAKLSEKENELAELADQLSSHDEVVYKKLFTEQHYEWDKNEISFTTIRYSDLLGQDGIVTKIKELINNKLFFLDHQHNNEIDKLIGQPTNLEKVIRYQKYLNKKEELGKEKELQEDQTTFLSYLQEINLDIVKSDKLLINPDKLLPQTEILILANYTTDLNSLKTSAIELSDLAVVHSQLVSTRDSLSSKFEDFNHLTHTDGECILCGFDWKESDILLRNITAQTEKIKTLVDSSSNNITIQIQTFKDKYVPLFSRNIIVHQMENDIDIVFVNNLIAQQDILLNSIAQKIELVGADLNSFLNSKASMNIVPKTNELIDKLKNLKKDIPLEIIKSHFNETFTQYFFSNKLNLLDFESDAIENKANYINWHYSLYQNQSFTLKSSELKALQLQVTNASVKEEALKKVIKVYKDSLKKYNQKLINDIEILFHIYSGRIVQDFQGGLGLFISNDKGIKFQTDPSKTYDAIFSMSSGQLSALIISFTLALNKKYSKNKILFIDDPVQTMDEINVVGFIELLRNDFANHQIFMSTHEDLISTFMRYKFKKYGLSQKRINVRETAN